METHAAATIEPFAFTGSRVDREGELALFVLEVKHRCRLRHGDGCLKASWGGGTWHSLFSFPPPFDAQEWQGVLEGLHRLANSLERRAA
jgi:hypothetical protein